MAWFRNHYVCTACDGHWIAEGVEALDTDCPHCHAYDVAPYRSDDLTAVAAAQTVVPDHAVAALKATAAKMRGKDRGKDRGKVRPVIRSKGRGAARVAVH